MSTAQETSEATELEPIEFGRHPDHYLHWTLSVEGAVARLVMNVPESAGWKPGYPLKLNSYDLGVDMELNDAVQRLRFQHPEVRVLEITSSVDKIFCSGANIYMLQSSTHPFKVNFCKYTNETRLYLEEYAREAGVTTIAACNGTASGGGYELAISCDEIHLIDDGSSAVSLPETPLLAVLPGTGGLTRLVDKRKVRRDLADVFCTIAEGVRGARAKRWNLVDFVHSRSKFEQKLKERAEELVAASKSTRQGPGIEWPAVERRVEASTIEYRYVRLEVDSAARTATLTVRAPDGPQPSTGEELLEQGTEAWALRMARELDDAILQLRFGHEKVGLILLKAEGDAEAVLAVDRMLEEHAAHWLVQETRLLLGRVLRRIDLTGRSFFAIVEPGSCFVGTLAELAFAADRSYMLDDPDGPATLQLSVANRGRYPMSNGLSRLESRFLGDAGALDAALAEEGPIEASDAESMGLCTFAPDDIDWEDEVRVAVEERSSFSPDALTGMEASLRFAGPETMETKIFGRLSAWQNWIFTRPNAAGETGALTLYGHPSRPTYDPQRT